MANDKSVEDEKVIRPDVENIKKHNEPFRSVNASIIVQLCDYIIYLENKEIEFTKK